MEDENGLSPFSVDMDSLGDIIKLIKYFSCTTKIDPRDIPKDNYDAGKIDYGDEEAVDATLPCDLVPDCVSDVQPLVLGENKEHVSIDSADEDEYHDSSGIGIKMFFDKGDGSGALIGIEINVDLRQYCIYWFVCCENNGITSTSQIGKVLVSSKSR